MTIALRILIVLLGTLMTVFGLAVMLNPSAMVGGLGLISDGPVGWSTIRGDIGAFLSCIGITMLLGLVTGRADWFRASMLLLATVFIGRAIGLGLDGSDPQILVAMAVEAVSFVLILIYIRQTENA